MTRYVWSLLTDVEIHKFMEKKKVIPSLSSQVILEKKESDSKAGPIIAETRTDFRPWCFVFSTLERSGLNKYFLIARLLPFRKRNFAEGRSSQVENFCFAFLHTDSSG